jgi:hypothetical protein
MVSRSGWFGREAHEEFNDKYVVMSLFTRSKRERESPFTSVSNTKSALERIGGSAEYISTTRVFMCVGFGELVEGAFIPKKGD